MALALVPLAHVEDAWQIVLDDAPAGALPALWNQAKPETPRTNNGAEGYHHKINRWVTSKHPTIYKLVKTLQLVEYETSIMYSGRQNGKSTKSQPKAFLEKEQRYKNILVDFSNGQTELKSFLTAASFLISFIL